MAINTPGTITICQVYREASSTVARTLLIHSITHATLGEVLCVALIKRSLAILVFVSVGLGHSKLLSTMQQSTSVMVWRP